MKIKAGRRLPALVLCAVLSLAGCGGRNGASGADDLQGTGGPSEAGGIQEQEAVDADEPLAPPTSFLSEEDMALADMWPGCDDRALGEVMRKAKAGESVTVACIGGSITQGTEIGRAHV